ncbi:tetratricopeptide repeat protein [Legionella worsleiensis]|uniref:Sel-1 protein n=1 Tax=Legionella worsleiensis TaxID=45076 RepID=A0A0W1A3R2_9GAMM|nr:SEL1-like repeat protein [Legionella worsleiensis]KTD76017.1 Sel-1 protein [Legionella worsleiensis]STY33031.1 Sel-1 protein [Legionella worsleiensis]
MSFLSRLLLTLIFIPLLTACISGAYNLHEGIQSFKAQDYRRAFIRLKPEAAKGQPDAQYAIGYMYYYGQGVVEDRKKAWYWINMAAKAGQPDAQVATKILERGSLDKKEVFHSKKLQHYPAEKIEF